MRIASNLLNEELRLQDLYSYDILDSESETEFDDLLEVATQVYACPMAAITFIDRDRQFFKALKGFDGEIREGSRETAFCSQAILQNEVLLVKDATQDERFCDSPYVTGGLRIRFYAGAPIISKSGYKLGTVCVIDNRPRELSTEAAKMLTILSQQVSKLLELRLKNKLLKKRAEEQLLLDKELLHKLLLEHDDHSLQISTALHENIAQGLAATKFYLELAEGSNVEKDELIQKSRRHVETLVKQVWELSNAITPTTLKEFCLEELLRNLLVHFAEKTGIQTKLLYQGNCQLPSAVAMTIYRIVEGQLKNVQHHAKATWVVVNMQVSKCIHLSIKDNGTGVEPHQVQKDIGLQKILSRVENLGGIMDLSDVARGSCQLTITIPVASEATVLN